MAPSRGALQLLHLCRSFPASPSGAKTDFVRLIEDGETAHEEVPVSALQILPVNQFTAHTDPVSRVSYPGSMPICFR